MIPIKDKQQKEYKTRHGWVGKNDSLGTVPEMKI